MLLRYLDRKIFQLTFNDNRDMFSFWVSLGLILIILSIGSDVIPVDGKYKGYWFISKICIVVWISVLGYLYGKNDLNLCVRIFWVGFGLSMGFVVYWWHPSTQDAILIEGLGFYDNVAYPNASTKEEKLWNEERYLKYKLIENQLESKWPEYFIFKLPRILLISVPILFTLFMVIITRRMDYNYLVESGYL